MIWFVWWMDSVVAFNHIFNRTNEDESLNEFIFAFFFHLFWPLKLSFHQNLYSSLWKLKTWCCFFSLLFNFHFSSLLWNLSQFPIVSGVKASFSMKFKPNFDLCIHWIHLNWGETETNVCSSTLKCLNVGHVQTGHTNIYSHSFSLLFS